MAQLQKGFEYDSSNPVKNIVTDDNLNALVANATLLSGAITEQTANSVTADTDIMLLSKAGGLIKQTKAQFTDTINSNIANINTVNAALVDADDVDTVDATLTGNLAVGGNSAFAGTANFTGVLQVNGAVGYVLTEVVEETMTPWTATVSGNFDSVWTSAVYTKPSNEIWVFEADFHYYGVSGYGFLYAFRYNTETVYTGTYKALQYHSTYGNNGGQVYHQTKRWVEGIGTTLSSQSVRVDAGVGVSSQMILFHTSYAVTSFGGIGATTTNVSPSKLRIYKYKTA